MFSIKKVLALIIALAMVISTLPTFAVINASAAKSGEFTYITAGGEAYIIECDNKAKGDVVIPDTLGGYPVTRIEPLAFYECKMITSVSIPSSVKSMGRDCFFNCERLNRVNISDIEAWSQIDFNNAESNPLNYAHNLYINDELVEELIIPEGVIHIKPFAFVSSFITAVSIPQTVVTIGEHAFYNCYNLVAVEIPDSVVTIGAYAFSYCQSLKSVTLSENLETIQHYTFHACDNLTEIKIPDSVTKIEHEAFSECSQLNDISFSDNITTIGEYAFNGTALYNNEDNWDNEVFYIDNKLIYANYTISGSYEIREGTELISDSAFSDRDNLTEIIIPDSVTTIGKSAFNRCNNLENVEFGQGVNTIGENAFEWCRSLKSVVLPDSVEIIDNYAFYYSDSLENVTLGNSVKYIGLSAFESCRLLKSIDIPDSVTDIGIRAFNCCFDLESVSIGKGLSVLEEEVFYECYSIKTIRMFNSITKIFRNAFSSDIKLTDIYFHGTEEDLKKIEYNTEDTNIFEVAINIHFECPCGGSYGEWVTDREPTCQNVGEKHAVCSSCGETFTMNIDKLDHSFENMICTVCDEECTFIESKHNYESNTDKTWTISKEGAKQIVLKFSEDTFLGLEENDYVTIDIPEQGFCENYYGSSLKNKTIIINADTVYVRLKTDSYGNNYGFYAKVFIPVQDGVFSYFIDDGAAEITDCDETASGDLVIPNKLEDCPVTVINDYAFSGCCEFENIVIPESVTTIGAGAFYGCEKLEKVSIPQAVTKISDNAFGVCTSISEVKIPNGVEIIESNAFRACSSLKNVVLPESLVLIGYYAFGDSAIEKITIPKNCEAIYDGAFSSCASLKEINVDSENQYFISIDGVLYDSSKTYLYCFPAAKDTKDYSIPEGVKDIHSNAFYGCSYLEKVTTPSTMQYISNQSFYECHTLKEIVITHGAEEIYNHAFRNCTSLERVTIPNSVTYFAYDIFDGCYNLTDIYFKGTQAEWDAIETRTSFEGINIHFNCSCGGEYGDLIIESEPTCMEDGLGYYECSVCSELLYRDLPATGHLLNYRYCAYCGEEINYIESKHPYDSNSNEEWILKAPGALQVILKFSEETNTESGWDFINIYDNNNNLIRQSSGSQLSGETITVDGDTARVVFTSDGSVCEYGFYADFEFIFPEGELGDLDGSGNIDAGDLTILRQILLLGIKDSRADINEDGAVDVRDMVHLKIMSAEN